MSQDAGSRVLESEKAPEKLTWKQIAIKKWEKKTIDCPLHPVPTSKTLCGTGYCTFESCPFVYWGCL